MVQKGGAALVPFLFWLYLSERSDRKDLQTKLDDLTDRSLIMLTELKGLITGTGKRNPR